MERDNPEALRYRFGDIEVDARRHVALRGGTELTLEPKALAVLLELLRHAGQVVSRDTLLDAVWGHRHVTPAVLNRIVAILRRELRDDAEHPRWIRTAHGIGYEFIGALEPPVDGPIVNGLPVGGPAVSASLPLPPSRPWRAAAWAIALLAAVAAVGWISWPRPTDGQVVGTAAERGVAVLPLVNAGGEADQQFFSDGLSENLITLLSQFEGLKVIGRGSSFRFRDGAEDERSIGRKLGVTHLLEGSVQRDADRVRIGVELVRTDDGSIVWTQRFDRPYSDLFALQDEIALAVAGALQVRLMHTMPSMIETGRPASGNLDAYNAYLRGTHYTRSDPLKAAEWFEAATRIDPSYGQAWSWLGFHRTQHARGSLNGEAARAAYAQARAEIDTALRLSPDSGQAHAIRANLLSTGYHDWNGALAEFQTALALVPDTDPSHGAMSRLLSTLGHLNEAIRERYKYIEGDPLGAFARVYLAQLQAGLGHLDDAEASLRDAEELEPEPGDWYASERSYLAILRGDARTALAQAQRVSPSRLRDRTLALALQIGSDRAAAEAALQRLIGTDGQAKNDAYAVARVYALRGNADEAFRWLQRDWERGDTGVLSVLADPLLLRFRDDARFAEYGRKTGLPPPSASETLDLDQIRRLHAATTMAR